MPQKACVIFIVLAIDVRFNLAINLHPTSEASSAELEAHFLAFTFQLGGGFADIAFQLDSSIPSWHSEETGTETVQEPSSWYLHSSEV